MKRVRFVVLISLAGLVTGLSVGVILRVPERERFEVVVPSRILDTHAVHSTMREGVETREIESRLQPTTASLSPLVKQWLSLSSREKLEILQPLIVDGHPGWLAAFLGEVAYAAIGLEEDERVAQQIEAAVRSVASGFPNVALFFLDHIERMSPHDHVRELARQDAADLRDRMRVLGR